MKSPMRNYMERRIGEQLEEIIESSVKKEITNFVQVNGRKPNKQESGAIVSNICKTAEKSCITSGRKLRGFRTRLISFLMAGSLALGGAAIGYGMQNREENLEDGQFFVQKNEEGKIEDTFVLVDLRKAPEEYKIKYVKEQIAKEQQIISSFETKKDVMKHMKEIYSQKYEELTGETLDPEKLDFYIMTDMAVQGKDGKVKESDIYYVAKNEGIFSNEILEQFAGNAEVQNVLKGPGLAADELLVNLWAVAEGKAAGNDKYVEAYSQKAINSFKKEICKEYGIETSKIEENSKKDTQNIEISFLSYEDSDTER